MGKEINMDIKEWFDGLSENDKKELKRQIQIESESKSKRRQILELISFFVKELFKITILYHLLTLSTWIVRMIQFGIVIDVNHRIL